MAFVATDFPTIRVQSVLYNSPPENIERTLEYLDNAALNARQTGVAQHVSVAYGDCSPERTFADETVRDFRTRFPNLHDIEYTHFGGNLGSAAGHNRLLERASCDFAMIMNPDVLVSPTLFKEMLSALAKPGVGLVEARQLPIEHPKDYDRATGETSWASTACAMGPTRLFHQLQGFDAKTFFLYCDDVDYSWRLRLAGYKVVMQWSAVVFHDKRLSDQGGWLSSAAERYYSAEAGLLLPYKYSRPDLSHQYLEVFVNSGDDAQQKAAENFELRKKTGQLPTPIDPEHLVAQFIEGNYARHRYQAR